MLALGLLLLLAGVIWAFLPSDGKIMSFHFVLNCVLVLIMAAFVYFSVLTKKPAVFYIFANFCILSLLSLILSVIPPAIKIKGMKREKNSLMGTFIIFSVNSKKKAPKTESATEGIT